MSTVAHETSPESGLIRALSARFEIDTDRESDLEVACSPQIQIDHAPQTAAAAVGLASVSTLVCRGKGGMSGTGYVVPTFAVHWGVIVRASLFHLRYDSKNKAVRFDWRPWEPKEGDSRYDVDVVGQTPYSTDDLIEIGIRIFRHWLNIQGRSLFKHSGITIYCFGTAKPLPKYS